MEKKMQWTIISILIVLLLVGCSSVAVPTTAIPTVIPHTAMNTITITNTPNSTSTFEPTATVTATFKPSLTSTLVPELTIAEVGLLWDPAKVNGRVTIKPCYIFSSTMFHAGDAVYFPRGTPTTEYTVLAPADGVIITANDLGSTIGHEVSVLTPFRLDGYPVYYDIVHSSGLIPGLRLGMRVHKGDPLAKKGNEHLDPIGLWIIDIGFRNWIKQANASLEDWTGLGYFSYFRLIQDDLKLLNQTQYVVLPRCPGNPIKQNKPYATPTPGGFGPYP